MIKLNKVLLAILVILMIFSFGCSKNSRKIGFGYSQKTINIGKQEWMTKNLNVDHYRNGDSIPEIRDFTVWDTLTTGAWCYYFNDPEKYESFGKLYNWYAVNDPRGLALEGWHIPSIAEWIKLTEDLNGEETAGGKLKDTTLWKNPNEGANNESGFSAIPGGVRYFEGFHLLGEIGCFWSSLEFNRERPLFRYLGYGYSNFCRSIADKKCGMSVRCIKDYQEGESKQEDKNNFNYSNHKDFNKFWADFKKAVNEDDKDAVLKMTNFPFEDNYGDVYDGGGSFINRSNVSGEEPGELRSLTSVTPVEFLYNYGKIFNSCVKKAINAAEFKSLGKTEFENFATDGVGIYPFGNGNYLLDVECFEPIYMLIFKKINGVYKLTNIPYQE
jgi:uncharacterized protein (TIGR02145 family)